MMARLVVYYQGQGGVRSTLVTIQEALSATGEELLIDVKAKKWCFADKRFECFESFKFGSGPTSQDKERFQIYPGTQVVFDKNDNGQITQAIHFLMNEVFGRGHEAGGAVNTN